MIKLAAIINLWDGIELLRGSIDCYKDHVDEIIIVWQEVSNFGEPHNPPSIINLSSEVNRKTTFLKYDPYFSLGGSQNEVKKRNIGLDIARELRCTHFFHIDVDEYYEDFGGLKKEYLISCKKASICKIYTYFKKPTLRLDM